MSQPQTIQSSLPSDPNVRYIDTVHAYDQWANVSTPTPQALYILFNFILKRYSDLRRRWQLPSSPRHH